MTQKEMTQTPMPGHLSQREGEGGSFLDRPLLGALQLNWEMVAWVGLIIVAAILRLVDLGVRAMSHDESLHTLYAYYLYDAGKYEHNPMMHGPLRYHLTALFYFLFGDNDATARLGPALLGIGIVVMLYFLRRYLGRLGALFAAVLVTISPSLLFHSRYIRDDIFIAFCLVVWIYGAFRYLETHEPRWLTIVTLGMIFGILAMEAHFISGAILGVFFVGLALWQVIEHKTLLGFSPLILGVFVWYAFHKQDQDMIGLVALAAAGAVTVALLWNHIGRAEWQQLRRNHAADLAMLMATLVLPFLSPFIQLLLERLVAIPAIDYQNPQTTANGVIAIYAGMVLLLTVASIGIAWWWFGLRDLADDEERAQYMDFWTWAQLMGLFWVIAILFYTTFLTNTRNGLASGIVGSLGYWLAQQKVERGSQPIYYYLLLSSVYEFLPMLLSSAGIVVLLRSLFRTSTWNSGPAGELPTDGQSALTTASAPVSAPTISTYFVAFCLWWVFGAWLGFTFAGEKMPWLMTHMALPMCILGGWRLGNLVQEIEWPKVWQRQAVGLVGVMPALILVIGVLIWGGPPDGRSLDALSKTIQWLLGIGMIAGLLYLVWRWELVVGWASTTRLLALGGVLLLFFLTIRTSYTLTFINFDMATEYLVYAHASPDIKRALNEIDLISERTVGARNIVVAYDDESSWPMSWYMRQYPNAKYYGQAPNSDNMTAPVIIVGPKNYDKVHPYVVRDYVKRMYRLIWWPDMGYFNLTWADLWKAISDPVQRERNWEIFFYRRWRDVTSEGALGKERDLSKWPHRHEFEMWVRRDLAAEIWDLGVAPVPAPAQQLAVQARSQEIDLTAQAVYNGEYAGLMLSAPRALAIGPEGERVIADTNNHRIVVLDANGGFVRTFGSLCKLSDNVGCVDPDGAGPLAVGDGQLNEPWGVAVDQTGAIFVADTWNGRIQVFGRNGQFLRKWGAFNTTNGELGDAYSLFGPRGLAVDQAGNLLVADTGNKRIIQFSPDGALVAQIGGGGVIGGRFEEPVGVAVSPADGSMVVADTWNRRIQKFTAQLEFTVEMAVPSWDDRSIFMKPYVAVAPNGDIYASDPQFYRVFIYNGAGELKANFGNFGSELNRFGLPNGLAVDQAANTLLVADAANNRIMVFPLAP